MRRFSLFSLLIFLSLSTSCSWIKDIKYSRNDQVYRATHQGLMEFPEEIFLNPDIRVIRLYGNNIDSIAARISELEYLEKLFIGKNKLKALPKEIGELKYLKVLSAQYNDIAELPPEIGGATSLEQLILNQNDLTELPREIGQLKSLKDLQLYRNSIEKIPEEIGQCTSLNYIDLHQNNLKTLPSSMGDLNSLRDLNVAYAGPLLQLPESMCNLRMLETLTVDNSIVLPPCMFVLRANRLSIIVR